MALHAPVPTYPSLIAPGTSPSSSSSSSSSSPTSDPSHRSIPLTRHVSRSERLLLAALRRADQQQHQLQMQSSTSSSSIPDQDYFARTVAAAAYGGDHAYSKHTATTRQSPSKSAHLQPPNHHHYLEQSCSRSPSPMTQRVVDRERTARRRTPSPSPHPYRPASPRTLATPHLARHQTAPALATVGSSSSSKHGQPGSRPGTPSRDIGAAGVAYGHPSSSSPARPYASRAHSRRESGSMSGVSPNNAQHHAGASSSYTKQMSAHEQYLRARLEGVLAASGPRQQQDNHMDVSPASSPMKPTGTTTGRTTVPNIGSGVTASGDQWNWSGAPVPALHIGGAAAKSASASPTPQNGKLSTRSPSLTHLAVASPSSRGAAAAARSNAMITPPPSPPYRGAPAGGGLPHIVSSNASPSTSNAPSRAQSQARSGLGHGHPSRASSKPPPAMRGSVTPEERVTPPPPGSCQAVFDARQASLALKNQHGYVSFCEVEGLGEPEGMFDDEKQEDGEGKDDCEDKRGRWWEVWRK